MSLKKCAPSEILIKPIKKPNIKPANKKILFLVKKYRDNIKNPTVASPDTKEQLDSQAFEILNQGVNIFSPPKSIISLGLALPQKFFKRATPAVIIAADDKM